MRVTLNLDDAILRSIRGYARRRSLTLGAAVGELIRAGIAAPRSIKQVNGFWVVDLPSDSPKVTMEHVRRLAADRSMVNIISVIGHSLQSSMKES